MRRLIYRGLALTAVVGLLLQSPAHAVVLNTKVSGSLVPGGAVANDYIVSPDGNTVVYRADQDTDNIDELYSVSIAGGTPTKLNGFLVPGGEVSNGYLISPDGNWVVYRADQDTDGVTELYSVPIAGGTPTKLNSTLVSGGDVTFDHPISADSSRVVYRADQDTDGVNELYSVPIAGGTVTKLSGTLVSGGSVVNDYGISPDGSTLVYRADQDTDNVHELYSVPIGGGTVTKLNGALVSGGDVAFQSFEITPDSTRVVYRADQDTDDVNELYSVPLGGGTVTKLNGPLVSGGVVGGTVISPDSGTVVYRADQDTDGIFELYSVPAGGGASTKLNGALVSGGNVDTSDFAISADSNTVVYIADQDVDNTEEVYSVPIGGGTVTKLNGTFVPGGEAFAFEISPDSNWVVYRADQDTDTVNEVYRVAIGGGAATKISDPLVSGGDVATTLISADSSRVVYRADQDTDGSFELYSVPIGGGTVTKVNSPLVSGGTIIDYTLVADDASTVVYRGDAETDGVFELFTRIDDATAPSATAIVPSTTGPTQGGDIDFTVTFDEHVQNFNDAADITVNLTGTTNTGITIAGSGDTYTVTVEGLAGDGAFTLAVNTGSDVQDLVGNALAASATSAAVTLDNTDPVFSSLMVTPAEATVDTTVTIAFDSSEPIVGDPDVTVNGAPAIGTAKAPFTFEYTIQPSDPVGSATIEISGVDDAGNIGVLVDNAALQITSPPPAVPIPAWPLALALGTLGIVTLRRTRRNG